MSEQNKDRIRRLYAALAEGRFEVIDELVADDAVDHEEMPGLEGAPQGKERVRLVFDAFRAGFPDMRIEVEDMIAEGDMVAVRAIMRGTHEGEFMGVAGTGNKIEVPFADYLRFEGGKMAEHWGVTDTGAMMQQLGVAGP